MDGKAIRLTFGSEFRPKLRAGSRAVAGSSLRCQCKLCGEAGRSGVANGLGGAGATRPPTWRRQAGAASDGSARVVEAAPDITMPELAAKLKAEKDVTAHPASSSRALLKAGLSFKKNTAGLGGRSRGRAPGA